jgi:ankyrin repeat protein
MRGVSAIAAAAVLAIAAAGAAWAELASPPPVIAAVKAGDRETAIGLIEAGAEIDARDTDGSTALLYAAYQGDLAVVSALIAAGADVNAFNDYGANALQQAASAGDAALIARLLEGGADVESPNAEGQTALMAAARTGVVEAARVLVEHGADVNARESWGGQTALMWAAAQHQAAMIAYLISAGADPNAQAAARDWERRVTSEPRIKEMLSGGFSPLLYAARQGCTACARVLIEGGADPDLGDPDGVTPIIAALLNFRFDVALYLVEEGGADVNRWDWYGRTPVFTAVDMATIPTGMRADLPSMDRTTGQDVVAALLARGADPNYRLKLEPPYRNIAFDRGADTAVLTQGSTAIMRAGVSGDARSVELLLAHGAEVDLVNSRGLTALMLASGVARSPTATRGEYVTQAQSIAVLDKMIDAGAQLDAADWRGVTALHGAAAQGWTEVVRHLAARGAPLDATDASGLTPRDYAAGRTPGRNFGGVDTAQHPGTVAAIEELLARETAAAASGPTEG